MKLTRISNIKIDQICRILGLSVTICMKNEFTKDSPIGMYIMNLENSDQGGTHWCSLIKMKNNKYLYMDSYGVPPPETTIILLQIQSDKLFFNDQQIQSLRAQNCGYYAIYFLYLYQQHKTPNKTIDAFLSPFSTDENENDKILQKIFDKLL